MSTDTTRQLTYAEALREALDVSMTRDPSVYILGLGTPDAAAIFGSTEGLAKKHGPLRVIDTPVSENAMTGVALGSALTGGRPVMTHVRLEFAMLAMDQICNQAAKWRYMFGGQANAPMVIRMIVGRGWGQGPQHSQSLHAWFAHVPGLKVIAPATPHDAKGLLIAAIEDDDPVVCIEHRWLYNISGPVPEGHYTVPIGPATRLRHGADLTVVASSYMTLEATRAAAMLAEEGIEVDVIDVPTINPLDESVVIESVGRTGKVIVADLGSRTSGFAAELVTRIVERCYGRLEAAPVRITLPDIPTPTTPALANLYYPGAAEIADAARILLGRRVVDRVVDPTALLDVPDSSFTGPF